MNHRVGTSVFLCLVVLVLFASCGPNTNYIRRMQQLEEGVDSPTTIEELTEAIDKYQHRVEDVLNADIRTGMWYKILAIRYLDNGMYEKALENFRLAVEFYPTNQNLFYYIGVCAGFMAKSSLEYEPGMNARARYLALSESAYLRAIELQGDYVRALYGLSVLYSFELNEPEKAIAMASRALEIEKKNMDAMFVLARSLYMTGRNEEAAELYDTISSITKDERKKEAARQNKALVLEKGYAEP